MRSNVSKTEREGQESESYQHEQDQECDGDELFAVKLIDAGRKEKGKEV